LNTSPQEGVLYFTVGLYIKYCAIERLVRKHFGEVEHYELLFARPSRPDIAVELALPKQRCTNGHVCADGASLSHEVQRLSRRDLVPIGSVHKHPINGLSSTDLSLLHENLAVEMGPALLRPFETLVDCAEAEFELRHDGQVAVDGETVPLGDDTHGSEPRRLVVRNAQAVRRGYRGRVFCLASNGGPKPRFHGQEVVLVRTPECPTSHTYSREIRRVLLVPGRCPEPLDEVALEEGVLGKLSSWCPAYRYETGDEGRGAWPNYS
jgi:hypothetical protein